MNKIFILLSVFSLGLLSACEKTHISETDKMVDASFKVSLPKSITSYSSNTQQGGVSNVDPNEYCLRYTVEIYESESETTTNPNLTVPVKRVVEVKDINEEGKSLDLNFSLVAMKYNVLIWADFVKKSAKDTDLHYIANNLRDIKVCPYTTLSDESRDAYCGKGVIDLLNGEKSIEITLKRPFAKVRFVALDQVVNVNPDVPTNAIVTYGKQMETSYDLLLGTTQLTELENRKFTSIVTPCDEVTIKGEVKISEAHPFYIVAFDYLFANTINASAFDVELFAGETLLNKSSISSIPLYKNTLSTASGNFYSHDGAIEAFVDGVFEDENTAEVE